MVDIYHSQNALAALARYLAGRRTAILDRWRDAVLSDQTLTTGASLPRSQLHDHLPALLIDFERRLDASVEAEVSLAQDVQLGDAQAHGLHRWQQGFDLAEVTRELGRLNECVLAELDDYHASRPSLPLEAMAAARRLWSHHNSVAISASAAQYYRLKQIEASGHIKDLENALAAVRELERQRAESWQQAAHDLRGNLGVVTTASAGLTRARDNDDVRAKYLRLLDRNVAALHDLLDDVTSLARLQGGLEQRSIEPMEVSALLKDLCEALRAKADERGLDLELIGPAVMEVQGDPVKLRRIAQNLVLNAIRYTREGGITVRWGESAPDDPARWLLEISDTGPGLNAGPDSQLADAIETATEQAREVAMQTSVGKVAHVDGAVLSVGAATHSRDGAVQWTRAGQNGLRGEGIGLSIVKRMCDLLDATVELDSEPGTGTTFRIRLPRRY